MHLVERDCKFAMFWPPDQGSVCTYYASIILDAQEHLLLCITYSSLSRGHLAVMLWGG